MLYDLNNKYQRDEFKKRVGDLWKKRAIVELTKKSPKRSLSQNKYLHVIIGWWALFYGCTADYAKRQFFKQTCNPDLFMERKTAADGTQYTDLRSSSALTTAEMTLAIDRFRDYCAANGRYIPSPDEREYLAYVQRELEKAQEFATVELDQPTISVQPKTLPTL